MDLLWYSAPSFSPVPMSGFLFLDARQGMSFQKGCAIPVQWSLLPQVCSKKMSSFYKKQWSSQVPTSPQVPHLQELMYPSYVCSCFKFVCWDLFCFVFLFLAFHDSTLPLSRISNFCPPSLVRLDNGHSKPSHSYRTGSIFSSLILSTTYGCITVVAFWCIDSEK